MKIIKSRIELEKGSLSYETLRHLEVLKEFIKESQGTISEVDCLTGELSIEITDEFVKISDKFIALLLREDFFKEFDLPRISLSDLAIPALISLKGKISLIGNFREEKFKLKLELFNDKDEKLHKESKNGIYAKFDNGEEYYLNPFLAQLVDLCDANYNHLGFNDRVAIYSKAKSLLRNIDVIQDYSIKTEEFLYLDKPEFTIGKDLAGDVVLKEVLPLQYTYFDSAFSLADKELNNANDVFKFSKDEKILRVMLSEESMSFYKKIQTFRDKGQVFLKELIENPAYYFSQDELSSSFVSAAALNQRITGFSFESKSSGKFKDSTDNDWSNGLEISSVYLYSNDGNSHQFNTEDILEDYVEIKKVLSETELEEIILPKFGGIFERNDLERLCQIIENKFDPDVNEFNFEEIKSLLEDATSRDSCYVEIDDVCVPTESVKRNLNNSQKTTSESKAIVVEIAEDFGSKESILANSSELSLDTSFFRGRIELRDHQKAFLSRALSLFNYSSEKDARLGLLLADDMGLGKTIQAISFIFNIITKPQYKSEPILIVAPVSLLDTSWLEDGFKKFIEESFLSEFQISLLSDFKGNMSPGQVRFEVENIDKQIKEGVSTEKLELTAAFASYIEEFSSWCEGKIILVSYELLRSRVIELLFIKFSCVVLDEAQKVKNINTAQTNAAKSLQARFNLALTGTPIENSLEELWSIMDFVSPGHLGYLKEFKKDFVAPLASLEPGDPNRLNLAKKLEEELKPLWIRRLKKDIAKELPSIIHGEYPENSEIKNADAVVISNEQKRLYLEGLNYFKSAKKGAQLQGIRMLLETCFAPWRAKRLALNYSNSEELFLLCPKVKKTIEVLEAIRRRNEKVIIFVNVVDVQYDLQTFIEEYFKNEYGLKLEIDVFNGKASKEKRKYFIDKFKKTPGFDVLIISPKAGGVGLNLVEANNVIHYTREWNPALEKQATDRVYRIGQKKAVNVYYPTTVSDAAEQPTAEQKLADLLCRKREVIDDFTIVPADNNITISDIQKNEDESFEDYRINSMNIELIDHNLLEALYAVIFEKLDYETQCVGGPGDQGVDVIGFGKKKNILIQVKHTSGLSVGYKGVQEIAAAEKIYSNELNKKFTLYTATNKNFSEDTWTVANHNDVELLESRFLLERLAEFEIMRSELDNKLEDREVIIKGYT